MDNIEASKILRENKVDSSFDPRQPVDILVGMVINGYLPGELLGQEVCVEPVTEAAADDNKQLVWQR